MANSVIHSAKPIHYISHFQQLLFQRVEVPVHACTSGSCRFHVCLGVLPHQLQNISYFLFGCCCVLFQTDTNPPSIFPFLPLFQHCSPAGPPSTALYDLPATILCPAIGSFPLSPSLMCSALPSFSPSPPFDSPEILFGVSQGGKMHRKHCLRLKPLHFTQGTQFSWIKPSFVWFTTFVFPQLLKQEFLLPLNSLVNPNL